LSFFATFLANSPTSPKLLRSFVSSAWLISKARDKAITTDLSAIPNSIGSYKGASLPSDKYVIFSSSSGVAFLNKFANIAVISFREAVMSISLKLAANSLNFTLQF